MGSRAACLEGVTTLWYETIPDVHPCETIRDVTVRQEKSPFIQACRREPVPYTPVWYMRQAGRSLPEYRKVREGVSMLDSCTRPDLITEITLQPLRRYDVDAAILFSDIVVPLRAVGIDVDIKAGIGPVVWGSAGDMADKIAIPNRRSYMYQEGQAVFRWATTTMHPIAAQACERAGVAVSDLSAFVPHQANLRIIEAIARKLGVPRERMADDIVHSGNTSSASVPLALARMTERGDLKSGSPALLLGFGAGMCYAAQVITVP